MFLSFFSDQEKWPKMNGICSHSQIPFNEGEEVMSCLVSEGKKWVRKDYTLNVWEAVQKDIEDELCSSWKSQWHSKEKIEKPKTWQDRAIKSFFELKEAKDSEVEPLRLILALLLQRARRALVEPKKSGDWEVYLKKEDKKETLHSVDLKKLSPKKIESKWASILDEVFA